MGRAPCARPGEVLRLFLDVCDAVAHAHAQGVVHRDLKPANVLVDAAGRVHVLDFGIAKVVDGLAADAPHVTRTQQRLLTPSYASPEQVRGDPVSPATDVHALGVVLFELLTGAPPFGGHGVASAAAQEAVLAAVPPVASRALLPRLRAERARVRGDVDTVVATALRKEPQRRYASAAELAADVRRVLTGLPVFARPDTLAYRARRFVGRNRALVGGVTATVLALAAGVVVSQMQVRRARAASERSQRAAYVATLDALEASLRAGDTSAIRAQLLALPDRLRSWEWEHLLQRVTSFEEQIDRSPTHMLSAAVAFGGRAGEWLALRDNHEVHFVADGRRLASLPIGARCVLARRDPDGCVLVLDFDCRLSLCSIGADGALQVTALPPLAVADGTSPLGLAVSPDGARCAMTLSSGEVLFLDAAGAELARFAAHEPAAMCGPVAWSRDGALVATGGWDESVQLFDARELRHIGSLSGHSMGVNGVAFDPAGGRLATVSYDRSLVVWDVAARAPLVSRRFDWVLECVRFVDGARLLLGDTSGAARLLSAATCDELAVFVGARGTVDALELAPDGERFVAADLRRGATVFDLERRAVPSARVCEFARALALAPDGSAVLTGAPDERARVWSLPALAPQDELPLRAGYVLDVAWSADGQLLATAHYDAGFALWRAADRALLRRFEVPEDEAAVGVSVDVGAGAVHGVTSSLTTPRTTLWTWPLAGDAAPTRLELPGQLGLAHQNARLVTDGRGAPLALLIAGDAWRFRGAAPPERLALPGDRTPSAIARGGGEGEVLLAGGGLLAVLGPGRGEVRATFPLMPGDVCDVSANPSRSRIAIGRGATIDLLDARDGFRVASLHGHADLVHRVAWTHDGAALVSLGYEGDVKVWRSR